MISEYQYFEIKERIPRTLKIQTEVELKPLDAAELVAIHHFDEILRSVDMMPFTIILKDTIGNDLGRYRSIDGPDDVHYVERFVTEER